MVVEEPGTVVVKNVDVKVVRGLTRRTVVEVIR